MTNISSVVGQLSDRDSLTRVQSAVQQERCATAQLIVLLMEIDTRRLYLGEGYSSLFTYCTHALHLSEHAAYNRIEAARAARRFPLIFDLIESAAVTLATIRLLAPHLTAVNHSELLQRARHKSKRDIELLVATLKPHPDAPSLVRKLPAPPAVKHQAVLAAAKEADAVTSLSTDCSPFFLPAVRPAEVKPLAPERYKIQVTVSREAYEKLRRAQELLRHVVPNGDPAIIIDRALGLLVAELERTKLCVTRRPRAATGTNPKSRHISAALKRMVWERDGGRCAFSGSQGRCTETGFLEYHHVVPFASGGETSASNLELRCRAHNQYEAEQWFGAKQFPRVREQRAYFGAAAQLAPGRAMIAKPHAVGSVRGR